MKEQWILLVDDDKTLAELGQRMLETFNYHVHAATNAKEGLELFQNNPQQFNLVITDFSSGMAYNLNW